MYPTRAGQSGEGRRTGRDAPRRSRPGRFTTIRCPKARPECMTDAPANRKAIPFFRVCGIGPRAAHNPGPALAQGTIFPYLWFFSLRRRRMHPSTGPCKWERPLHRAPQGLTPRPRPATSLPPVSIGGVFPAIADPLHRTTRMREMKLQDLKAKTPAELVSFAEELEVENASTMRKQELMFGILKQLAARETDIIGEGVVEVLLRWLWLPALAGSQLPARARRHLRLALADPPLRAAHRRHHRRPHPQPQGRRALFRAAQGQYASISRTPRRRATRSTSTTSPRSIPTSG